MDCFVRRNAATLRQYGLLRQLRSKKSKVGIAKPPVPIRFTPTATLSALSENPRSMPTLHLGTLLRSRFRLPKRGNLLYLGNRLRLNYERAQMGSINSLRCGQSTPAAA